MYGTFVGSRNEKKHVAFPAEEEVKLAAEKIICRIDEKMIENLHFEAGNDELAREWLEYVICKLIKHEFYLSKRNYKFLLN